MCEVAGSQPAGRVDPWPPALCARCGSHRRAIPMSVLAQQLLLGVLIGGLYGLAAAGLSLVFGVLRVLNVAHGDLIVLGGYGAFWLFALLGLDPFLSLLLVVPAALAAGALLYWGLFASVVRFHDETRIKNSLLVSF